MLLGGVFFLKMNNSSEKVTTSINDFNIENMRRHFNIFNTSKNRIITNRIITNLIITKIMSYFFSGSNGKNYGALYSTHCTCIKYIICMVYDTLGYSYNNKNF